MNWQPTVSLDRLEVLKPVIYKHRSRQICLIRTRDRLYAFNNRCPHEGYPLREGTFDGKCILTCNWHNWKFDLRDGKNLLGDDNLRTYPTKIEKGRVWVDMSDPPAEALRAQFLGELKVAFEDRRFDRIARVLAKFHFNGLDPKDAVIQALHWTHDRLEYGMTHAFAVAPDWLLLHDEYGDDFEWGLCFLTEAVDHMAYDAYGQAVFPFTQNRAAFNEKAFLDAIENEDENRAVALLNHALDQGRGIADLVPCFSRAALAHYRDFGHSLIYVKKIAALVRQLGPQVEKPLLYALTRSLCYSTREELLPEFRSYVDFYRRLESLALCQEPVEEPLSSPRGLAAKPAMAWVVEALARRPPQAVYQRLLETAAHNLLCFNESFQEQHHLPIGKNFGWLDLTHAITFANALRAACETCPELWKPGLLQLACFTGRAAGYIDPDQGVTRWRVADEAAFQQQATERLTDHGYIHPIYACHLTKTFLAAREEWLVPGAPRKDLQAALNRFLHSRMKEKHVRRTVKQAMSLIGKDFGS